MLYKVSLQYDELKSFGCLAFIIVPLIDKFKNRGMPFVFHGYPPSQKGYRLLSLLDKSIIITRDLSFNEDVYHQETY